MKQAVTDASLLVSIPEIADLIGASVAHVWRLISSGRFGPAIVKLGRLSRVRRDEFNDWIAAGCPARARWEWEPPKGGCRCAQ